MKIWWEKAILEKKELKNPKKKTNHQSQKKSSREIVERRVREWENITSLQKTENKENSKIQANNKWLKSWQISNEYIKK